MVAEVLHSERIGSHPETYDLGLRAFVVMGLMSDALTSR